MLIQTYNEFRVTYNKGEIIDKQLTKRATVRIDAQTAEINNGASKSTGLLYELKEDKETKKAGRPALEKE